MIVRGDLMGPFFYEISRISGDYAYLVRTDIDDKDEMIVALALLPLGTDVGTRLKWEDFVYTVLD